MKVLAVNGSPRKEWNTATLLNEALEGVDSEGAETELVHLYELDYKGCISCFACKKIDGNSYGKCAVKDELTPVLEKAEEADAIIFGSPIYFGRVTGEMRSFLERLLFQYLVYDQEHSNLLEKKILTGFIYTMNVNKEQMKEIGYEQNFKSTEMMLERIFGSSESLLVTDTYQFEDYSKYVTTAFDEEAKAKRKEEVFPKDCEKAFEMGARFARQKS
ncbi:MULTISPECIES: flavodoxin family protein [unclassified Candidatus Frackibacter]|uniref:flavodoxin family protein n=1 Tax=unclassified Candidatus Frackibacter TaxID=2648818 RepID=UPI00088445DC|nr:MULTISPECIES: flavodoxin family protein [unclassified Candidatus Frackibacter]SDC85921.1 Multimeric flavodoxin WrbA [Candidatus Frackibacter sp. WG11]SEN00248.1 Multimeric flavodoxin WrbA [Candidatus Frackibacter sp. WG12]SFL55966.1 Multimeric flavodoxin WrbA [Candidatus Frackibacter sp. WG13]